MQTELLFLKKRSMYEMIIVGAGPAGISMAAEARSAGIRSEQILMLEKGETHSWAIHKFYAAK
ncbi:MAG: thioredoxin reductase [Acidobacteriota bacterium]|jgi:thioredoxin reductase|nr:thioredoxin reductase [Acidobacteriota bacterium]